MYKRGELDGIVVADFPNLNSAKNIVRIFKSNGIKNLAVLSNPFTPNPLGSFQFYWLEQDKIFIPYLEVNLIDSCNLNCKGCSHFANLFAQDKNVYPIENFRRDVKKLSELADVLRFNLLGGEPFLVKNLDDYIEVSRHFLPQTRLEIVTNGLLIPTLSQKILDSIKNNNIIVNITGYKPTMKNIEKIKSVLDANKISYYVGRLAAEFMVFMSLNGRNDPNKSLATCPETTCRFLRDGRIYKCACDALSFKLIEKFHLTDFAVPTFADIYAQNFSSMLEYLDGAVEMCHWCSENSRNIAWQQENKPKLTDWLFDPTEVNRKS